MNELYLSLLKQGWTLPDIDGMDILFYFSLIRHSNRGSKEENDKALDLMGL